MYIFFVKLTEYIYFFIELFTIDIITNIYNQEVISF